MNGNTSNNGSPANVYRRRRDSCRQYSRPAGYGGVRFNEGYTAEEIVAQYPSLSLSDVYAVIAYYLNERAIVDAYLAERAEQARVIRADIEAKPEYRAFRKKLIDKRASANL